MKTKRKQQNSHTLWTPSCQKLAGTLREIRREEIYVATGWVVDGEFYCAECVHRLVENNIPLPPSATAKNPRQGSIAVGWDADGAEEKMTCEGCGAKL